MDSFIVISSESSPPSSPSSCGPVNRVSDLCRGSPTFSSPLPDSGYSNSCPLGVAIQDEDDEDAESYASRPRTNPSAGNNGRYNFHFISDSDEDEGVLEGPDSCDFRDEEEIVSCINQQTNNKDTQTGGKSAPSKDARRILKELKAKEKAEKAELLTRFRQIKPGECLKYVTVNLDIRLLDIDICSKAIESIKQEGAIRCEVIEQRDPYSVTWSRKLPSSNCDQEVKENFILFIWSSERLTTSIKYCTLLDTFRTLRKTNPELQISLVIYGLKNYCRMLKKVENMETGASLGSLTRPGSKGRKRKDSDDKFVPRKQIEMALAELEVILQISNRIIDTHEDLSLFLHQFTKAVSEIPYRKEIEKRDNEKSWFARGDSRDCVRIDKDFNGLSRLWLQQICQFNLTSIDAAKAIVDVYPTPLCLYEAYEEKSSQKEKECLLQNIQIKRSGGTQAVFRKIGPELSRKLYLMFSQNDGNILLSKE